MRRAIAASILCCAGTCLIYLERDAQEQLLNMLVDTLRPGGYLVLGRVEGLIGRTRRSLAAVDARERIFRKSA